MLPEPSRVDLAFTGLQKSLTQARLIRKAVVETLSLYLTSKDLIERCEMISEELAENIVKYSVWESPLRPAFFMRVDCETNLLTMRTRNVPKGAGEHANRALEVASALEDTSAAAAYQKRLQEVFTAENSEARLGLLRIAFEGEAHLKVQSEQDDILQVTATIALTA